MKSNYKNIYRMAFFLLAILFYSSCKNNQVDERNVVNKQLWTCSMHPEIIRDQPGTCPICGMDLVKKVEKAEAINDIQLNDLLQPTDRFVVSSIPVTTIQNSQQPINVDALGTIGYDTRLVNTVSARISGRIEKLYVKSRYQHIMKGQRIMDIYSPELLTTEQELLYLIKHDPSNTPLINASRQKLLLLGMGEKQLNQIITTGKPSLTIAIFSNYSGHIHEAGNTMPGQNEKLSPMDIARVTEELSIKEGMYIEKGQNIFQLYNVNRSWALLSIFPESISLVKKGDAVKLTPETAPSKAFRAKVDFIEPVYRKENKTVLARVYFDNSKLQIPIGSQVKATIFVNDKKASWLPITSVLSLGIDRVVFIKEQGGFKAQKVQTGLTYKDQIQIVAGLNPGDSVAVNAQYLTDSESFIKATK